MKKRWLVIGAILLLAVPLVLLLQDFTREVLLIQVYRLFWTVGILFDTMPQVPAWFFFVLIVAAVAVRSLVRRQQHEKLLRQKIEREGQIHRLTRWLERAAKGEYFRWSLEQRVADLSLEVMAYRLRIPREEIRQRLREGSLAAPPEIHACLEVRTRPAYSIAAGPWIRFRQEPSGDGSTPLDPSLELVVQYLEDQMEVHSDR